MLQVFVLIFISKYEDIYKIGLCESKSSLLHWQLAAHRISYKKQNSSFQTLVNWHFLAVNDNVVVQTICDKFKI